MHRSEIQLSAAMLAVIPSSTLDPEALMIEAEERQRAVIRVTGRARSRLGFSLRSPRLMLVLEKFLPVEESFLVQAYYLHAVPQTTLADTCGVTHQAVSYRLKRAKERIRWALSLETWWHSEEEIRTALSLVLPDKGVQILSSLWANRFNQSTTSRALGIPEPTVRDRVFGALPVLGANSGDERVAPYGRDLSRVVKGKGWCIGATQVHGHNRIQIPHAA
jgi:hypothetical protein